jgi:hypothetical protein
VATKAKIPGVAWHLAGAFHGNRASGTVEWSLVGPYRDTCTPSSGSVTWHAALVGGIETA